MFDCVCSHCLGDVCDDVLRPHIAGLYGVGEEMRFGEILQNNEGRISISVAHARECRMPVRVYDGRQAVVNRNRARRDEDEDERMRMRR